MLLADVDRAHMEDFLRLLRRYSSPFPGAAFSEAHPFEAHPLVLKTWGAQVQAARKGGGG